VLRREAAADVHVSRGKTEIGCAYMGVGEHANANEAFWKAGCLRHKMVARLETRISTKRGQRDEAEVTKGVERNN
jgi:hypothetical protein